MPIMSDDHFQAFPRRYHQQVLSNIMGRLQSGKQVILDAVEFTAMSQLSGNLNHYAAIVDPPSPLPVGPQGDIPYGDYNRYLFMSSASITTFSFRVPVKPAGGWPGPNGALLRLSAANYQGSPHLMKTCVSLVRGKLDDVLVAVGKETPFNIVCGVDLPEGAMAYINMIAVEEPPNGAGGSSVSIIWPLLVYP